MIYKLDLDLHQHGLQCDHQFEFLISNSELFFKLLIDRIEANNLKNKYKFIKIIQTHEIYEPDRFKFISDNVLSKLKKILDNYNIEAIILEDNNLNDFGNFNDFIIHKSHPFFLGMTTPNSFTANARKFEKKFISLNCRHTTHRHELVKFLYDSDVYKNTVLTHHFDVMGNKPKDIKFNVETNYLREYIWSTSVYSPILENATSFCNIVTETFFNKDDITFITEKTEKCFSAHQPFISVTTPFFLKKLKELGFKTFDKWWDESYDNEVDNEIRMEKIKNTIRYINSLSNEKLSEIYSEMQPILVHNNHVNREWYIDNFNKIF